MTPTQVIALLKEGFPQYTFDYQTQGGGWSRAFIIKDGVSYGRINFCPEDQRDANFSKEHLLGCVYGVKQYGYGGMSYKPEHEIFFLWDTWLLHRVKFNLLPFLEQAKKEQLYYVQDQLEWRKANPAKIGKNGKPRSRPYLDPNNYMGRFYTHVREHKALILRGGTL